MNEDDFPLKKNQSFAIGQCLDALSLAELDRLKKELLKEIARVEKEIEKKNTQAQLADNLFKK